MHRIRIGRKTVGEGVPVFVIAEVGVNHNGDLALAKRLVDAAGEAGADAVKFQTFKGERVATPSAPKALYQAEHTDPTESQLELLRGLELSPEAHHALYEHCANRGVLFLSTPFDEGSADFLEALGVPAFKVGSGELTNWPLLTHIARKGKPLLISTGMSYLEEVGAALEVVHDAGSDDIALLHCVSNYPANPAEVNLRAMTTMAEAFRTPIGYSDHTRTLEVAYAAVALGACIIEKHLTLDRTLRGPDHQASLEPEEFRQLVMGIRNVESALGTGTKVPATSEEGNRRLVRRSLAVTRAVPEGTVLRRDVLTSLRPGGGIPPAFLDTVVGRKAKRALTAGQVLSWEDLE